MIKLFLIDFSDCKFNYWNSSPCHFYIDDSQNDQEEAMRWSPFYFPPLCACTCQHERNMDYGVARTASFTFRRNRPFVATRFANLKSGLRHYVVSDGQNNLVNSKKNNENSYMTAEEYANNPNRKYGTSDDYSTYKARNNHYGDYTYSGDYEFEDQIESEVK